MSVVRPPWTRLVLAGVLLAALSQPAFAAGLTAAGPAATDRQRITGEQAIAAAVGPAAATTDAGPSLNNQRYSDMGGDVLYDADSPAAAYNSASDEYFVVWRGDDNTTPLVDGEYEIFGRRVDASSGLPLGADLRLSDMGPDGSTAYGASTPAVAYNSTNDEYLVVWRGDDNTSGLVNDEFEIFGQRVEAATGNEIGSDLRLSDMGPDGSASYAASDPDVAYNSTSNNYLVVWRGDDNANGMVDNRFEIFTQRIDAATGLEIGGEYWMTASGPTGTTSRAAFEPVVAASTTNNEYLLVWRADNDSAGLADNEYEIFGIRVSADTGLQVGSTRRLSEMGPDGNSNYGAFAPAAAYNSANHEFLVVWSGDDNTAPLVDGELEVYGQRVDAATTNEMGARLWLSEWGPDGNPIYGASAASVAYDPTHNEYLAAWQSDNTVFGQVDDEFEIHVQRLSAATGQDIGREYRLTETGGTGNAVFAAFSPASAYSPAQDAYLVVWHGDDNAGPLVAEENEVFGQRVDLAAANQLGSHKRLSDMGGDDLFDVGPRLVDLGVGGDESISIIATAVAYNSTNKEYLVVWHGDDNTGQLADGEVEIFGQRVEAATGNEIGGDFRISVMGPNGFSAFGAFGPAVAYNSTNNEYLVVWFGDSFDPGLVDNEYEVYGQRLAGATGQLLGGDLRLSDMGPDGNPAYAALTPAVAYNSTNNEYLVVWRGYDYHEGLGNNEFEIFGQRVSAANGLELGSDFELSDMGPEGDIGYDALDPAVAYNSLDNQYLVVWWGDDDTAPLVDNEYEIFGQRLSGATGQEIGGDFRLSDMGPNGSATGAYMATSPAVTYNSTNNEYLVVWTGDDNTGGLVAYQYETFGQRVAGATGQELGGDLRLTFSGPDGSPGYVAFSPSAAYNHTKNEYLITWWGNDTLGGTILTTKFKIFGQRLAGSTALALGDEFRLSAMGPDDDGSYDAWNPAAAFNSADNEYLVVWSGEDNTGGLVDEELEVFGQRFSPGYQVYLPLLLR